jgi:hypothetical protein
MDLPTAFLVVRMLLLDTFRQSLASRLFWLIVALSGLCIALCLSVRTEGETASRPPGEIELLGSDRKPFTGLNQRQGQIKIAFGAVAVPMPRDAQSAIRFLHALLARVAAAVGTFLLLLWTSGFLPEFLEPRSAAVLLAKPPPRWSMLAGKFLGVLLFATLQVVLFVGGTWLALALATGVWHAAYLLSIPLLVLLFAMLYSVSALLAVLTGRTVVCIFGTLLFWVLCAGVDGARYSAVDEASPLVEASYWILPKPTDCVLLLDEALQSDRHFRPAHGTVLAERQRLLFPELSWITSLLFVTGMVALAAWRFVHQDY